MSESRPPAAPDAVAGMLTALAFPAIDPVAIAIGPFAVRWYALAYVAGLLLGWRFCRALARRAPALPARVDIDDLLLHATLGVILGGRLGYALFYKPAYFAANPLEILMVWQGGMSFHGGFLGVLAAMLVFARRRRLAFARVSDIVAAAAPIGLFFGRIANFINGELYGRTTDRPWGMVFPGGGPEPRHPSQLYEAALEGLLLFAVLGAVAWATDARRRPWLVSGLFLAGYGLARIAVEQYREPDAHLGFALGPLTMGQLLSAPMVAAGVAAILFACRRPRLTDG